MVDIEQSFEDNVLIYSGEQQWSKSLFINGVPFNMIGRKNRRTADFLNSLGLENKDITPQIIIPLNTMFRFTVDNTIDNIEIIKNGEISMRDVATVENKLHAYGVKNFSINSYLDAKNTVNNVIGRFSILTNTIYTMLTIMAVVTVNVITRRNFQLRGTEFAIKVIHGVNRKALIFVVVIETFVATAISVLVSILMSYVIMFYLSSLLMASIMLRFTMIFLSITIVVLSCYLSGMLYGMSFLNRNPLRLIKERML